MVLVMLVKMMTMATALIMIKFVPLFRIKFTHFCGDISI